MIASVENPIYSAYIITSTKQYNVTNALVSIDSNEQEKQIAACATLILADVEVDGKMLSNLIKPRHRVIIKANDGQKNDEVFRGYAWDIAPKESLTDNNISIKSYDNLIYWQESQDYEFFSANKSSKEIMKALCKKWGIDLTYDYETCKHSTLVLRGCIADFVTADVLTPAQNSSGKKYVIQSKKDRVYVTREGSNTTIYNIDKSNNAVELRRYISMNGVTTQVIVMATSDDKEMTPIEATVSGKTSEYGTLQKIVTRNEDMTLAEAKKEAKNILDENGKPKWSYDVKAVDIPWIRKGDKVNINTNTLKGAFIVKSISREISNRGKLMTLTVVDA